MEIHSRNIDVHMIVMNILTCFQRDKKNMKEDLELYRRGEQNIVTASTSSLDVISNGRRHTVHIVVTGPTD